jgi:hypothetical protein
MRTRDALIDQTENAVTAQALATVGALGIIGRNGEDGWKPETVEAAQETMKGMPFAG